MPELLAEGNGLGPFKYVLSGYDGPAATQGAEAIVVAIRVLQVDGVEPGAAIPTLLNDAEAAGARIDWFCVSPPFGFGPHNPGTKPGTFRLRTDVLVTAADGNADISGADFAAAVADEIESLHTARLASLWATRKARRSARDGLLTRPQ
jgi:hypothetical protein